MSSILSGISHELTHAVHLNLSFSQREELSAVISPLVAEARKQALPSTQGKMQEYMEQWEDGSRQPRFGCVTPYAASDVDEYIADTMRDILTHNGTKVVHLFRNGSVNEIHSALLAVYQHGFLGDEKTAYAVLKDIYERGGYQPPERSELPRIKRKYGEVFATKFSHPSGRSSSTSFGTQ